MDQLKFVVLDEEDLEIVSTHLQDAVAKVSDVLWRPQEKRLVLALNRFDWEALNPPSRNTAGAGRRCASSGCCRANAAISTRPARTPCSICWTSSLPRPMRRPAW